MDCYPVMWDWNISASASIERSSLNGLYALIMELPMDCKKKKKRRKKETNMGKKIEIWVDMVLNVYLPSLNIVNLWLYLH